MHNLIAPAEVLRGKYKFEIDGSISAADFFKAKFCHDRSFNEKIHDILYKKIVKQWVDTNTPAE